MERRILVVSDATASTAEDVLRAALGVDTSLKSLEESACEVVSLAYGPAVQACSRRPVAKP